MNQVIRCACYVRVSTDNQLENYSIKEQTERLTAFCKAKDYLIVKFYTDGAFSGGSINRPALQQMLGDIEKGLIDAVIVYKLDRLSREQKDTLMLIEDKFLANHVDFISLCENFDTSTPFGLAMIGILSAFSQLEKNQITERFTMGRIGRAKNGLFHGGSVAPTGYDYIDGQLVINEYEALQVRDLYTRFSKGYSLHNCWQYMQKHYYTKYGGWKSETLVRNVLKNDVYIGKVKFNGQSYPGIHEPIIPEELFQTVQDLFEHSRRDMPSFKRSPFKANTLLSGLIYCGKCGARCHGEHGNYTCYSRSKGDKRQIKDPDCKNKKWKIEELDVLVIKYVSELDFEETESVKVPVQTKVDYGKRISEIEKQLSKLIDLYQISDISFETISEKIEKLSKEKNALIEESEKELPEQTSNADRLKFQERFLALLDNGPLPEKRACLTQLIERITITDEDIEITLK